MPSISLISVVRNEEKYIRRMIESAVKIVNEIVIIDQQSEDKTQEIATKVAEEHDLPLTYIVDDVVGYAELSREKAIHAAKSEYVLLLDGDEMLVPTAAESILTAEGDGYFLNRKTIIHIDQEPCIIYVSKADQLRYARRDKCGHFNSIHNTIRVSGSVGIIPRAILEVKTVEEVIEDYERYETVQHHDFQTEILKRLYQYQKEGPPEKPWCPPYWGTPAEW